MRYLFQLMIVLVASMTLIACSTSTPPVSVQRKPLPAAYVVPCQPPASMMNEHVDAALIALKEMYDLYGECGGRLMDLVNYLEQHHE